MALSCSFSGVKLVTAPLEARLLYISLSVEVSPPPNPLSKCIVTNLRLCMMITVISLWLCDPKMPPKPPVGHGGF